MVVGSSPTVGISLFVVVVVVVVAETCCHPYDPLLSLSAMMPQLFHAQTVPMGVPASAGFGEQVSFWFPRLVQWEKVAAPPPIFSESYEYLNLACHSRFNVYFFCVSSCLTKTQLTLLLLVWI